MKGFLFMNFLRLIFVIFNDKKEVKIRLNEFFVHKKKFGSDEEMKWIRNRTEMIWYGMLIGF